MVLFHLKNITANDTKRAHTGAYYEKVGNGVASITVVSTDINDLIYAVYGNEEIAGIVNDPYTKPFFLEKRFLSRIMIDRYIIYN